MQLRGKRYGELKVGVLGNWLYEANNGLIPGMSNKVDGLWRKRSAKQLP